ncbi:MAG TPA: aspartate kinase [Bryobacteraceae bacterium]|nr:aspartate kinase [Bryobacteraceae bacterium]
MKFGGSSVQDAGSIERVASVVNDHLRRQPIVVVSAVGDTTDRLLEFAQLAAKGRRYEAWRVLEEIQQRHFELATELASGAALESLEQELKEEFRTLHLAGMDLCENGSELTSISQDCILSFGERLSSMVVTTAFVQRGLKAATVDARRLILTDSRFTRATPLYWESYARIRWNLPHMVEKGLLPVVGGFIAANEQGVTTTLGRGGSDLSAAIIGAGVNAEEIQIWTDVDGMLTSDPRVFQSGLRLTEISYDEAAEMAKAGAKVLHPDTMVPAIKLRIPITIRNSRLPHQEGTRITIPAKERHDPVKSIACLTGLTTLEIRPVMSWPNGEFATTIATLLAEKNVIPDYLVESESAIFIGVKQGKTNYDLVDFPGCTAVRLWPDTAVVTLVGDGSCNSAVLRTRVERAIRAVCSEMVILPVISNLSFSVLVNQAELTRAVELLHKEFFVGRSQNLAAVSAELKPAEARRESPREGGFEGRLLPFKIQPVFSNS